MLLLNYKKQLGGRIKEAIKSKFKNLDKAAEILGYSKATISTWQRGIYEPPPKFILKVAQETGYNIVWLISGEGEIRIKDAIEKTVLSIRDKISHYNVEETQLNDIINALQQDPELTETVWYLVKAKQGIKNIKPGE